MGNYCWLGLSLKLIIFTKSKPTLLAKFLCWIYVVLIIYIYILNKYNKKQKFIKYLKICRKRTKQYTGILSAMNKSVCAVPSNKTLSNESKQLLSILNSIDDG